MHEPQSRPRGRGRERPEGLKVESGGMTGPAVPPGKYSNLSFAQRALVATFVAMGVWYLGWRPSSFNPDAMTELTA